MKFLMYNKDNDCYIGRSLYTHNTFNFIVYYDKHIPARTNFCQLSQKFVNETYMIDVKVLGTLTIDVSYQFDDLYYGNKQIECNDFMTRYIELFPEQINLYND